MIKVRFTSSLLVICFMLLSCMPNENEREHDQTEFTGMIKHTLYFYFKEDVSDDEKLQFESDLRALLEIPYISSSLIGRPAQTESRPITDHDFGYTVIMWFASVEDHDQYQIDPLHKQMVETTGHLFERIRVLDSEMIYQN